MKRSKVRKVLWITSYLVSFLGGFVISKVISIPGVHLGLEINPTHLISIMATLFIALVLSITFELQKEKHRVEKNLIFQRLSEANEIIDKIQDHLESGTISTLVVNSSNKRLRSTINCTFDAMKVCGIKIEIAAKNVDDMIKEIHDLLTNTPATEEGAAERDAPIRADKGTYYYSPERGAEVVTKIGTLKNKLFKLQMQINNS